MKFTFYFDPGHEWLAVPMELVRTLDLKVSEYSYYSKDQKTAYLEGDCDASAFAKAYETRFGTPIEFEESDRGAFIRKLPRFAGWAKLYKENQ